MLTREQIRNIAQGDVDAFRVAYDHLASRLLYYVRSLVPQRDACEDIVHESFVFLWEHRAKMDDVVDLKAYLFTVAHNLTRNYIRDNGLHRRILRGIEIPPEPDEELIVTAETCGEIRNIVASLPAQTRQVIELSMHGLTVSEVAKKMAVSPNTVKTLKKNGYRILREKLGHIRAFFLLI